MKPGCDFPVMAAKRDHLPKVSLCAVEFFNPYYIDLAFLNIEHAGLKKMSQTNDRYPLSHLYFSISSKFLKKPQHTEYQNNYFFSYNQGQGLMQ